MNLLKTGFPLKIISFIIYNVKTGLLSIRFTQIGGNKIRMSRKSLSNSEPTAKNSSHCIVLSFHAVSLDPDLHSRSCP